MCNEFLFIQFGGTEYEVLFGRRDSLTANLSASDEYLPSPQFNYTQLVANFARVGLNEHDLVTLSGMIILFPFTM